MPTKPEEFKDILDSLREVNYNYRQVLTQLEMVKLQIDHLAEGHNTLVQKLERHMTEEESDFREFNKALQDHINGVETRVLSGFPEQDLKGHHDYHADAIETTKTRRDRINEIITYALKNIVWAALAVVGAAAWFYFKTQVKV